MSKPNELPKGSYIHKIEDTLPEFEDLEADFPDDELGSFINGTYYDEDCKAPH